MRSTYKDITDCLKSLIETQDFIVIPEFGALVMQMESAEFSIAKNVLFPPRKKMLFNPLLKHNDGLLIAELQKQLGIEAILAQTIIQQFVQSLNIMLETKRRAELEDIGYFYKDIEGNVLFESSLNPFYLSESLGLYPVSTISMEKNISSPSSVVSSEQNTIVLNRKNLYKAAVVFLAISLLFFYWWLSPVDIKHQMAGIFEKPPARAVAISSRKYPVLNVNYSPNVALFNSQKDNSASSDFNKQGTPSFNTPASEKFSIVAGCFKLKDNAHKLLHQFESKGLEAALNWNEQKQLFVVSVGSYENKERAVMELKSLKEQGILKDGWIKEEK